MVRQKRLALEGAQDILSAFEDLSISTKPVSLPQTLAIARRFERSAYGAAYLALAESQQMQLITADRRLYKAVHGQLAWVLWVEDYD